MDKKAVWSLTAAGCLLLAPVLTYAQSNTDKLEQIQSDLHEKQQEIQEQEQAKQSLEQSVAQLQQRLDELGSSITKNEQDLAEITAQKQQTEAVLEEKLKVIAQLEEDISKRQQVIDVRLQTLQEQPRTSLITEVLLNARNLVELLENFYSISTILDSDSDILKEQLQDKNTLEREKLTVEEKQLQLQTYEDNLQLKQQELESNQQQQQALLEEMHTRLSQTVEEIEDAEEAAELLQAQKEAVQKAIEAEERMPASLSSAPAVNAGGFIKPAAGYYSSGFGQRSSGMHYGIDIAQGGNVPIYAAAGGIVIKAYYSSTYGNVVFLSHRLNGQTYTTVYAHLNSMDVTTGQAVSQGQQIGIMGNTGASRGQHLHFELHIGEWNMAKSNAVDPMPYLK